MLAKALVIVADINFEAAKDLESKIISKGWKGKAKKTDVSKSKEVEELINETFDNYKKIDIIINK